MLYYGSRISENITKTPEGFLICMNVPINRTGHQTYLGKELMLDEDTSNNPNKEVDIVRDEDDVFDRATLASFEGKPIVNEHPDEDVDVNNYNMYANGHCQNVRRDGEYTIADLYITEPNLIRDIENGKREISCGYTCDFVPNGDGTYKQVNIRGNHIAVVNSGRAGEKVRINDAKEDLYYVYVGTNYRGNVGEDFYKQVPKQDLEKLLRDIKQTKKHKGKDVQYVKWENMKTDKGKTIYYDELKNMQTTVNDSLEVDFMGLIQKAINILNQSDNKEAKANAKRMAIRKLESVRDEDMVKSDSNYETEIRNIKDNDYKTKLQRIKDVRSVKDSSLDKAMKEIESIVKSSASALEKKLALQDLRSMLMRGTHIRLTGPEYGKAVDTIDKYLRTIK